MKHWRDYDAAPETGTRLCHRDEIADGGARPCAFRSGDHVFELFVLRRGDALLAYVNDCPHNHTPLDWKPGQFFDAEKAHLMCATHGALFRIEDGYCIDGPCKGKSLTPVPLVVNAGEVFTAG